MPEKERIGEDVLGYEPSSRMSEKKRKELEAKLREELKKKKAEEKAREELEKLPKLPIPGEKPEGMPPEEWAELQARGRLTGQFLEEEEKKKTVKVKEHKRRKPKRKFIGAEEV